MLEATPAPPAPETPQAKPFPPAAPAPPPPPVAIVTGHPIGLEPPGLPCGGSVGGVLPLPDLQATPNQIAEPPPEPPG